MSLQFIRWEVGGGKIEICVSENSGGSDAPPGENLSDHCAGAVYNADAERACVTASGGRYFKC